MWSSLITECSFQVEHRCDEASNFASFLFFLLLIVNLSTSPAFLYHHIQTRGTFACLALHCWHNRPGELTSQHEASVTRHLLFGTHFLGQYLTVLHWLFLNLGLKLTCFTWLIMTMIDVIWPPPPPPLKLRPYGGIEMCVLVFFIYPR